MWHVRPTVDWIYRDTCHEKCTFSENFQINLFQHLHMQMCGTSCGCLSKFGMPEYGEDVLTCQVCKNATRVTVCDTSGNGFVCDNDTCRTVLRSLSEILTDEVLRIKPLSFHKEHDDWYLRNGVYIRHESSSNTRPLGVHVPGAASPAGACRPSECCQDVLQQPERNGVFR
jgi:hypothetical protein